MANLYIIGNGFDLHHWIDSGFDDYGEWLKEHHSYLHFQLTENYNLKDKNKWKCFEHVLGELNVESQLEEIMGERRPEWGHMPEDDKEFDDCLRDYEAAPDEAHYTFSYLYNAVRDSFGEWVKQLSAADRGRMVLINRKDSWFINFNYTDSLESLYKIPQDKIIYIHGCAKNGDELILGHNKTKEELLHEWGLQPFDDDVEEETYNKIIKHLSNQRKPIEELIGKLHFLLNEWKNINVIHVYGFSFSDIDMPYIEEIAHWIECKNVKWEVSYFDDDEEELFVNKLVSIGIPRGNIQMVTLEQLMIEPDMED